MKGTTERVRLRYPEISEDEFDQISSTAGKLMATAYKLCDRRHAKEPGMGAARRKIRHAQELIEIGDMLRQHPDLSRETIDRVFGAAYLASR